MKKILIAIVMLLSIASCSTRAIQSLNQTGSVCEPGSLECKQNQDDIFKVDDMDSDQILNQDYPAPDLVGLTNWINSDEYSSLDELKGQVVLIDFWTLGCINCIHTFPHLNELYEKYNKQGFEILGLHAPEFAYERRLEALQGAVQQYELTYPIAQDNDFATWKAYKNRYWPAHYLIDRDGNVRYTQFGQGKYEQLEQAIVELINE